MAANEPTANGGIAYVVGTAIGWSLRHLIIGALYALGGWYALRVVGAL